MTLTSNTSRARRVWEWKTRRRQEAMLSPASSDVMDFRKTIKSENATLRYVSYRIPFSASTLSILPRAGMPKGKRGEIMTTQRIWLLWLMSERGCE